MARTRPMIPSPPRLGPYDMAQSPPSSLELASLGAASRRTPASNGDSSPSSGSGTPGTGPVSGRGPVSGPPSTGGAGHTAAAVDDVRGDGSLASKSPRL